MKAKKLIEVALPIKEISAESVRDKSIRHGHISTLHLWWARRPLPVCRAIVFASLVPDPLDPHCPQAFRDAVAAILGPQTEGWMSMDIYLPYKDIPYTSIVDPMEDNLRNRLMMFIGKFSDKCQQNMLAGKSTPPKEQLSEGSLIKWENKNNKKILRMARELIYVAYHAERETGVGYETLHRQFDASFDAIAEAEDTLYGVVDRHIETPEVSKLEDNLKQAIEHFQNEMPSVFDPFAGGGAIPLEAARLGCRSFGNDINPVAHIIERGSAEFPQKYGKPIVYSEVEFLKKYGQRGVKMAQEKNIVIDTDKNYHIPNRLSWDVEYYAKELLEKSKERCLPYYDYSGQNDILVNYWVRTAKCSNPSCKAEIPLLKQFYLSKRRNTSNSNWVYLNPVIYGNKIEFEIKKGIYNEEGWNKRCNVECPCCGNITKAADIKQQFVEQRTGEKLIAVIKEENGIRQYCLPSTEDFKLLEKVPAPNDIPNELLPKNDSQNLKVPLWGYSDFGSLFSKRQLFMINVLIEELDAIKLDVVQDSYGKCVITYLGILIDKIVCRNSSFGIWHKLQETVEHPFGRQALPMVFDYPEMNPFSSLSGGALGQLEAILNVIEEENGFFSTFNNIVSGDKRQFKQKSINCVVTDPPYYDAISYADLSDFFYVWLKRSLGDMYPEILSTPLTPKAEECTAIKHRFGGDYNKAKTHFEDELTSIFDAIEKQTKDVVSIMFAHQSTEAWTTLCNSILGASMNITGSWPMDTEVSGALKADMATLESSVTVACRPSERRGFGEYKEVKRDIEAKVKEEVESLYELGFRGADLLTACFGQAVSEFGRYKTVEKADGSEVSVGELLEMARNAAFDALLAGVQGDDYTKFYVGWLQLNGAGETDYDDATKFTRVGVNVDINDIKYKHLLILDGKKLHIAMAEEHLVHANYGLAPNDSLIDQAHRAILLWREGNRQSILRFVANIAPESSSPLWRLLATLKELLPACDDLKDVQGLLQNADDLRQNCQKQQVHAEGSLDF